MKITYTTNTSDIWLMLFHKQMKYWHLPLIVIFVGFMTYESYIEFGFSIFSLITPAIVFGCFLLVFGYESSSIMRKNMRLKYPITVEINEEGIYFRQNIGDIFLKWFSFDSIVHFGSVIFLRQDNEYYHIIPRRAFISEQDYKIFYTSIRDLWKKAQLNKYSLLKNAEKKEIGVTDSTSSETFPKNLNSWNLAFELTGKDYKIIYVYCYIFNPVTLLMFMMFGSAVRGILEENLGFSGVTWYHQILMNLAIFICLVLIFIVLIVASIKKDYRYSFFYSFNSEGFSGKHEKENFSAQWSLVKKIKRVRDYILISERLVLQIIPPNAFGSEVEREKFYEEIMCWWKKANEKAHSVIK